MLIRYLRLLALAAFAAALPAAAHHVDDGSAQGAAASQSVAVEEMRSGVIDELVVIDQVKGQTQRYPILRQADGNRVALRGDAVQALTAGGRVTVSGAKTGVSFTVTRVVSETAREKSAPAPTARVEGRFMVAHSDDFETGTSRFIYQVFDDAGGVTDIDLPFLPSPMATGMQVVVDGNLASDGTIVAQQISIQTDPPVLATPATINYLVLPIKFPNNAAAPWTYGADPFTPASLNNLVFGSLPTYKSAQEYFKEVSYGQQLMSGITADNGSGGFLLATVAKPATCDINVIANAAGAAAHARGYPIDASGNPLAPYTGILYVFNNVTNASGQGLCGWAGLAYVGYPRAYANNTSALWVIGHELGHNFGLLHAGSLTCSAPAAPIGCGAAGSVAEYGDPFSAMGNSGNVGHFNAAQKDILGWIAPSTVKAHSGGTATYTLSPIETGGQSTYAVRIPTTNANRTYWIEYRQPAGVFDAFIVPPSYPNAGAQIRIEYPFEKSSGSDDTEILDMTPTTTPGNFHDAALLAGAPAFVDAATNVTINVLSATTGANGLLTVQVTTPSGTPTTTTLTSSPNPSNAGAGVTFTATVTGLAPTGTVSFTDGGASIAGCASATVSGSGNSRTAACFTSSLTAGTHSIVATYSGDATNGGSTSPALTQVVNAVSTNVALASNGGVASASSTYVVTGLSFPVASVNNGDRAGLNWFHGGGWNDNTANVYPDWVQINFSGQKTIDRVIVYTLQDNYASPVDPPAGLTFSLYGLTDFQVQTWNGSAWVTVGSVSGNNLVKRTVTFAATTTDRIRIYITGSLSNYSRITEVEAWTAGGGGLAGTTTTLASSGNPVTFGTGVTFTATVNGVSPTGNVSFTDGGAALCAGALTGSGNVRTATCSSANLAVGSHNIVASYGGDAGNFPSASGQLAQVITAGAGTPTNVALVSNGGVATASSTYVATGLSFPVTAINDGDRAGLNWFHGGGWNDNTANVYPDWVQINFNGQKTIDRVSVYTVQDNYASPVDPSDVMTFSQYGVTDFQVQTWDGSAWVTVGSVSGNNLVKRTVTFAATTTDRIRINITGSLSNYSRITEVEAWTSSNVALASNGGVATASSTYVATGLSFPVAAVNDGDRAGLNWFHGGGWNDNTADVYPDWVQINFNGQKTIDHVSVYTLQDNYASPVDPSDVMTFSQYGVTDFQVQTWNGSAWVTAGSVSGNNLVKRTVNFTPTATDRIRINITGSLSSYSRITEVEAWGH